MLIEYIERLRTRPLAQRRRFALLFAGCVTLIIAVLWGLTLPARFASLELNFDRFDAEMDATREASTTESQSPLQGLINVQETFRGKPPAAAEGEYEAQLEGNAEVDQGSNSSPSSSTIIIATSTNEVR